MKKMSFLFSICFITLLANAQVLLDETFDYDNFTSATGWTTTGSVTAPITGRTLSTSPILTYSSGSDTYILSGVGKTLTNDYKTETANYLSGKAFTTTSVSETFSPNNVYLSFLYKVKAQGGTQSEIIGLTDALNNTGGVKLWYGKGASTSTFKLGITRSSGAAVAIQWYNPTTALDANATYLIVVKYDFSTATASFFVNPLIGTTSEPTANAFDDGTVNLVTTIKTSLSHLLLRGNGSNASCYYMSGIRVSQSWSEAVAGIASTPRLSTPVISAATNITSTCFEANWTPVENAVGYDVYVYWGTSVYSTLSVNGQSTSNLIVAGLIPENTYTYKVVAKGDRISFSNSNPSDASPAFKLLISSTPKKGPKIILKLDDLQSKGGTCAAIPVLDFLMNKQIKAGFGAIAIKFDAGAFNLLKPYLDAKNMEGDQLFEIWNHGLEHVTDEFSGSTYEYQKIHFDQATQLMMGFLNVQMRSFGTPYNSSDATTNTVMSEDTNYKVFLLGSTSPSSSTGIINLTKRVNMESATGDPSYSYFITNYNTKKDSYTEYMILQGHPNQWTEAETEEVNQIIQFLRSEGCEFVLPYDYYRSLSLTAPTNLSIQVQSENNVKLVWNDNTNSEYNYKIERSIDGINWINIATCPENSTSYTDTDMQTKGIYHYRVCANCGIKSDFSNVVETSILNGILKTNNSSPLKLNLFPNPCKDKVTISYKLTKSGLVTCDLFDITGKLQKTFFSTNHSIGEYSFEADLANIQYGIYLCKLNSSTGISMEKICIAE